MILYNYSTVLFPDKTKLERLGLFGDLFGGMIAFFSAVTSAGLVYTILVQRSEIKFQQEEAARSARQQARMNEILLLTAELNAISAQLESVNLEYDLMIRHDFLISDSQAKKAEMESLKQQISEKISSAKMVSMSDG